MKPNSAITITLWYLVLGGLWIIGSDVIAQSAFPEQNIQTIKGLLFIAVTALLIYSLVHRIERIHRISEATQRAIVDASPTAMYSIDLEGNVLSWNRAAESIFGWSAAEVIGKQLPIVPADKQDEFAELRARVAANESFSGVEVTREKRDGRLFRGRLSTAPMFNAEGNVHAIMATMEDITEQQRATEALEESEERFRTLVEAAPEGILIQTDGIFTYVNTTCVDLMGATRAEDLLGTKVLDRIHPEDREQARKRMNSLHDGEPAQQIEQTIVRMDGSMLPVESVAVPFRYQGRESGLGFIRDISGRRRDARERERLLKAIEQTADAIVITDTHGVIEHVNPAVVRSSGYSEDELIGATPRIQNSGHHTKEFYHHLWQTITDGLTWRGRIVNRHKNGDLYTEDVSISPLFDDNTIVNYVAVKRDITHELSLEQQLNQAQKMETVGRLAGGVAHDFNNMLSVILGYNELALAKLPHNDPVRADLTQIATAAQRSADLTRQLLAFARRQIIDPKLINLNDSIGTALKMVQRLIGEHISLEWRPAPDLWPVLLDPSQIDQILVNLAVNSRDAIEGQGQLRIRTANCEITEEDCADHPELTPGQYVLLSVFDNGQGIDEDAIGHIFEPFFTTKPEGTGTGLGLATVYGIARQNKGSIEVESEKGHGTTFRIFLPRHESSAEAPERDDILSEPMSGGETILLVEDEPSVLALGQRVLENLGYTILATESPAEAVEWAKDPDNRIDLLLTDVVMPELSGRELHRQILEIRPEIKVLFMSGYTADTNWLEELAEENRVFLQKPYSSASLAKKVRQALDAEAET